MELHMVVGILVVIAVICALINEHLLKMPHTIGTMFVAMVGSLAFYVVTRLFFPEMQVGIQSFVGAIDFRAALFDFTLCVFLFAGTLNVDLHELNEKKVEITIFSTIGVFISTFLIGSIVYYLFSLFNFEAGYLHCLIFGALISPTDPVAVLGILTKVGAPRTLQIKIVGESLFNDGVGVVVFATIISLINSGGQVDIMHALGFFCQEFFGGILIGFLISLPCLYVLKKTNEPMVEILVTIALAYCGYLLANILHLSGPLAVVVMGLMIGNHGRRYAMEEETRKHLDMFWSMVDELFNVALFVIIGLEVLTIEFDALVILVGVITAILVLGSRFITIGLLVKFLKIFNRKFSNDAVKIMSVGGLRGGISIALALMIPESPAQPIILTVTYVTVAISIVIQGLMVKRLVKRSLQVEE